MAKHDSSTAMEFKQKMKNVSSLSDQEFQNILNDTVATVELSSVYGTNEKLKIYSALSDINNCSVEERAKYIKKAVKCL